MGWLTLTDPFLRIAFWIGLAASALIVLLVLQIVALRLRLRARNRRTARVVARWRPVMAEILASGAPRAQPAQHRPGLPMLRRAEETDFLKLWLHFQATLRGDARSALNWLAVDLGCEAIAKRMLARRDRGGKLLAILVLGHLGHDDSAAALQQLANGADRLLAVHATLALVQIDPEMAALAMAPGLVADQAWPVREVVTVLRGARVECIPVLTALLQVLDASLLPRVLQVMEGLRIALPPAALAPLLALDSEEVNIGVLRLVSDPSARPVVLALAGHADWRVRMHAAKALARVGRDDDVAALTALLSDREWWVRYRSAQVLAGLPFLDGAAVAGIAAESTDRFAADMLRQVLAENAMAA